MADSRRAPALVAAWGWLPRARHDTPPVAGRDEGVRGCRGRGRGCSCCFRGDRLVILAPEYQAQHFPCVYIAWVEVLNDSSEKNRVCKHPVRFPPVTLPALAGAPFLFLPQASQGACVGLHRLLTCFYHATCGPRLSGGNPLSERGYMLRHLGRFTPADRRLSCHLAPQNVASLSCL